MDVHNTFQTTTIAGLARLEYAGVLAVAVALALLHLGEVDWRLFVGLFVVIDVVGYLPGRIAFRRSEMGCIPRTYYVLYNSMHSLTTWTVLLGTATVAWGWRWAFLAVPIHLLGDRALFGNSLKSFGVSFEPVAHPAFTAFQRRYAVAGRWQGTASTSQLQESQHARA